MTLIVRIEGEQDGGNLIDEVVRRLSGLPIDSIHWDKENEIKIDNTHVTVDHENIGDATREALRRVQKK